MELPLLLYIASAIIFVWVAFNLLYRANFGLGIKIAICAVLLAISLKYEVYQVFGGAFFAPQLPRPVLLAYEALYGAFLLLFFLLLLWDIYLADNWILAKAGMPVPQKLPAGYIKCGLVLSALGLGCWGTWQAVKVPEPRIIDLKLPSLPSALNGLKLVQLSDIHIGPILKKDWLSQVVERVNALEPDIIALTGDYVDGYADKIAAELAPLGDLRAKYGVLGVTGNHEYYWNMPEWKSRLEQLGITMLDNSHKAIQIEGHTLVVAGIPDLASGRFGFGQPDLAKALEGAPQAVRILLSHQPRQAPDYARHVDLILSGHTHGALMFFLQPLVARFNQGFVKGIYQVAGKMLYVSPGTGLWNGFSNRIGVPSEITLFVLSGALK